MKKKCNGCLIEKTVDNFHKRGDKWQPYCKQCKKEQDANRWKQNKNKPKHGKAYNNKKYRKEFRKWAASLKENKPCTDCDKMFHFAAMQWDHLPKYKKEFNIGSISNGGVSKKRYLEELDKCELVCANCHAVRTFNRRESSN
jgi:hypothetical protein